MQKEGVQKDLTRYFLEATKEGSSQVSRGACLSLAGGWGFSLYNWQEVMGFGCVWCRLSNIPTALASLRSTFTCKAHVILIAILGEQMRKLRHRGAK